MIDLNINLPKTFLDEEVRCNYKISHKEKEIWAVELDLLAELDRVCKKHNIQYCADGGTALGAVRHKGFIPWDDDIDIAMLRSDFERLNAIAPKEFEFPYFWQTEQTDPGSARGHAQLRNSNTTGILIYEHEYEKNVMFNQGIFIDIFPFDNLPNDLKLRDKQNKKRVKLCRKYQNILASTKYYSPDIVIDSDGKKHYGLKKRLNHFKYSLTKENYKSAFADFEKAITLYNDACDSEYVANLSIDIPLKNGIRYKADFDNLVWTDFEFLKIPIFKNYDRELKFMYGSNYMEPIRGADCHGSVIFDVDQPYVNYLSNKSD